MLKLDEINQLLKTLEREVWVVTAAQGDRRAGLLATFVSPISIVPSLPRLAVALSKQHHTCELVQAAGAFAVHPLRIDQLELAWHFGTQSGHDIDKFATVDYSSGVTGSPVLTAAPAYLECRVEASLDTGDRTLFLAEVVAGDRPKPFAPLTQSQLIGQATPEQLQCLRTQLAADAERDAAAIRNWRMEPKNLA